MSLKIKILKLRGENDFAKVVGDVLRSLKVEVAAVDADYFFRRSALVRRASEVKIF